MEEGQWKRDETPYLVFQCVKCQQYSCVKTTQKTKKCLRCNRTHQVRIILGNGEIVKGMTAALDRVKELQNQLAHKQLGKNPNLATQDGFSIVSSGANTSFNPLQETEIKDGDDIYPVFLSLLDELSNSYKEFPYHLIELIADTKGISKSEIPSLVRKSLRENILTHKNSMFRLAKP